MIFRFSDGDTVDIEASQLQEILKQNEFYLQNYLELEDEIDDPSYVARGNGFCETKYSEDFVESQIAKYRKRVLDIQEYISSQH